jgi:hypothetical protein
MKPYLRRILNIFKLFFNPSWFMFSFGGDEPSKAPTSQTVTNLSYPEEFQPMVKEMGSRALAQASSPYVAYNRNRIAGFDPLQLTAQQAGILSTAKSKATDIKTGGGVRRNFLATEADTLAAAGEAGTVTGFKSFPVTGVEATGSVGTISMGNRTVALTGVSASGQLGSFGVFYWSLIDDSENANWQNITNTESAGWALVDTTEDSGWELIETL